MAALESGTLAGMLAASWQARRDNIARRRDPITGVSEFAMPDEIPLSRRPYPSEPPPAGLPRVRYAEPFEALRDRSDAQLAATGARPTVFLAAFGPVPGAHRAAGLSPATCSPPVASRPWSAPAGRTSWWRRSGPSGSRLALLCSSDAEYAEQAAPLAAALKAAGAVQVWIAGPPDFVEAGAGIDAADLHRLRRGGRAARRCSRSWGCRRDPRLR